MLGVLCAWIPFISLAVSSSPTLASGALMLTDKAEEVV
ncbi:hypothetical protein M5D96_001859 [Drosophila gunungcola]|uniref:Uncharacterized protein n=1 Tax=Drosophila gunungcola TaxID=103775 RepID=A0A9P9YYZ3_9MUSC|nr:hypothetical protein M5D96_001859 [Drosophila gunungcola]